MMMMMMILYASPGHFVDLSSVIAISVCSYAFSVVVCFRGFPCLLTVFPTNTIHDHQIITLFCYFTGSATNGPFYKCIFLTAKRYA